VPELIVGPLLRYVGDHEATVWVETDASCEVEVLGHRERTFQIEGHHYAIVAIDGLEPGTSTGYEVTLDGERRWPPPEGEFPPSAIRTLRPGAGLRVCFGSCRVSAPHAPPHTGRPSTFRGKGRGVDALYALAHRMRREPIERWPDLVVMLGDQVYADDVSPRVRELMASRRAGSDAPGNEVADFEEYTRLYWEAWGEPTFRWLGSSVAMPMIFDDHDVHDDWNTSHTWVEQMRAKPWWDERIVAGFMSYWIYQHLGNLSPAELRDDPLLAEVKAAEDGGPALRRFALRADREPDSARWSFHRDLGTVRLLMVDSRAGRVLEEGRRSMLDEEEWAWLERYATGGFDHLLVATSLPIFMAPAFHWLEALNERMCSGALGPRAARAGEWLRQTVDLEHWPAFQESFRRLARLLRSVARGERGSAPATITALSGDVHFGYLTRIGFPDDGTVSAIHQAVCSPFRNALGPVERAMMRVGMSRAVTKVTRALAHRAGATDPGVGWRFVEGQTFNNHVATLELEGRRALLRLEHTSPDDAELALTWERRLA
jgi:hypothetical protein